MAVTEQDSTWIVGMMRKREKLTFAQVGTPRVEGGISGRSGTAVHSRNGIGTRGSCSSVHRPKGHYSFSRLLPKQTPLWPARQWEDVQWASIRWYWEV